MTSRFAIAVEGMHKRYGGTVAANEVSFDVREGEIFGLLGPNGAGKTTIVECLGTIRRPDHGRLRVLGMDPQRDARELRLRIGIQLQAAALPERMKLWEALELFGCLYSRPRDWKTLAADFGLSESIGVPFGRLSGGEKQRAFVALALINDPDVVFLDELTTSLDPRARRATWDIIRDVRAGGATVFLTTHFMDEAERLCDRVAIMAHGTIVALDTPSALVRQCGGGPRLSFSAAQSFDLEKLASIASVSRVQSTLGRITVRGCDARAASEVLAALNSMRVPYSDVRMEQPTLEDVFLDLTSEPSK